MTSSRKDRRLPDVVVLLRHGLIGRLAIGGMMIGVGAVCVSCTQWDDGVTEYDGPYSSAVEACTKVAGNGDLREDPKLPYKINFVELQVEEPTSPDEVTDSYLVSGTTSVNYAGISEPLQWSWKCEATKVEDFAIEAALISFESKN